VAAEAGGVPAVDGDKCAGTKLWALGNNDALRGGVKGRLAWYGKGGSGELLIDIDAVVKCDRRKTELDYHANAARARCEEGGGGGEDGGEGGC